MKEALDLVIEKISENYRDKMREMEIISREVYNLERQLENKDIPHKKYLKLENQLMSKIKEKEDLRSFVDGISHAREIVFDLY